MDIEEKATRDELALLRTRLDNQMQELRRLNELCIELTSKADNAFKLGYDAGVASMVINLKIVNTYER